MKTSKQLSDELDAACRRARSVCERCNREREARQQSEATASARASERTVAGPLPPVKDKR